MAASKDLHVVTFRIEPKIWKKFLSICKKEDLSGSQVLRNYINLIVTQELSIKDMKLWEQRKTS